MKLKGKVAIITAAAGAGIGKGIARALAKEGANIVVNSRRMHDRLTKTAEGIAADFGVKAIAIQADVCNSEEVNAMIQKTLDEFGRIDILVNNAGTDRELPTVDMDDKTWDLIVDTNLKGTFICCRAVLPAMIKQNSGKIVNISSVAAWGTVGADSVPYNAAKAGVNGLTYGLSAEVAKHNINVNCIPCGLVANPFLTKVAPQELLDNLRNNTPIKRDCLPEDIGNAVVFLASDDSSFMTGVCMPVSGGLAVH